MTHLTPITAIPVSHRQHSSRTAVLSAYTTLTFGSTTSPFTVSNRRDPSELEGIAERKFKDRPIRLMTAGYIHEPEKYEGITTAFLESFINQTGHTHMGLITSFNVEDGSMDAITTLAAQKRRWTKPKSFKSFRELKNWGRRIPVIHIISQRHADEVNVKTFPKTLNGRFYRSTPKFIYPTVTEAAQAAASVSNALLVTGGRTVTVSEFVKAIARGHRVVILDNKTLDNPAWDEAKERPDNAARYLVEQLAAYQKGEPLPHREIAGKFDQNFLNQYGDSLTDLVQVVQVDDSKASILNAARAAAEHLEPLRQSTS